DLPTYAFQRERYWLNPPSSRGDAAGLGLETAGHPLLGAVVPLPDGRGTLWTGRLSVAEQPWLADHTMHGRTVVPASTLVELALHAGEHAGTPRLAELTCHRPLALSSDAVSVQVLVADADAAGRSAVEVFARAGDTAGSAPWARYASGTLTRTADATAKSPDVGAQWPPSRAIPQPADALYERAARSGVGLGPAFHAVRALWRRDGATYAEVALPGATADEAGAYGMHPVLLDAVARVGAPGATGDTLVPEQWSHVELSAVGGAFVRVSVLPSDDGSVSISVTDETGEPVLSVGRLTTRPVTREEMRSTAGESHDALFDVDWVPVRTGGPASPSSWGEWDERDERSAPGAGTETPALLVTRHTGGPGEDPTAATRRAVSALRDFLADERYVDTRLAVVTRGAVGVDPGEGVADLAAAPVWGLVRAAQFEHPDRLLLVDVEPGLEPAVETAALRAALGTSEPQAAVRGGNVLVPRLSRTTASRERAAQPEQPQQPEQRGQLPVFGDGTVLVTGGTGGLGALVARHLAAEHGVRRLLLVSRRGPAADGVSELVAEIEKTGAAVRVEACDVGDRDALAALLAALPDDGPLTGVVHCAGVVADGVIDALDAERLARVFRPKAEAALHLHELTRELDLSAFVLFSSVAGVFGAAGRANYAAANSFLDALAHERRARGLPAVSAAWGLWEEERGMGGQVTEADLARIRREGAVAMSADEGLALLDAVLVHDRALTVPARLDLASLAGADAPLPAVLRKLVATGRRRLDAQAPAVRQDTAAPAKAAEQLARSLAGLTEAEQVRSLLALVRGEVAAVLGHSDPDAVTPDRGFLESGFSSVAVVELRNRLSRATGLRFSAATLFDHSTPRAVARHLRERLAPEPAASGETAPGTVDGTDFRTALAALPIARLKEVGVLDALLRLTGFDGVPDGDAPSPGVSPAAGGPADDTANARAGAPGDAVTPESIDAMDLDSLVDLAINTDV
ncbi:hypothetical protein CIB93_32330, partial [Streptomyces sp. WZ.A104]|uniref:type I polyketide synthase n=1 Tax=Streptomyces sp. WZ.A104 TaxID=2023771 RepID=UPI000BD26B15